MTARALDFDFAPMSEISRRAPWSISLDEQEAELRDEIGRRRDIYPMLVQKGRGLTQDDADRHIFILGEILADCTPIDPDRPREVQLRLEDEARARRLESRLLWEDKIREVRRELEIRRRSYPGMIEKGRANAADARERMERLEAVQWRYWIGGFTWDEQFLPALNHPDATLATTREVREHCRRFDIARWAFLLEAHDAGAAWAPRIVDDLPADGRLPRGHWWRGWLEEMRSDVAMWRRAQLERAA